MAHRRVTRSHQDSKGTPCCCMCSDSSGCVHCTCVQSGVMCSSCLSLRCSHCSYLSPEINCPGIGSQTSSHNNNGLNDVADVSNSVTTLFNNVLLMLYCCIQRVIVMMILGVIKLCLQLVTFKNSHYDLPNGSVSRDFVTWLSSQIDLLAQGSIHSERVLLLC